jgi:SsrA-binding protein
MTQPTERSARAARPARPAGDATKDAKRDFAVATNRKALHDYFVESTIEAGLALKGTEVKSLRQGKAQLADSYAAVERDEVFLHKLHISPYEQGNRENHEPMRRRKLLLHRREIHRLQNLTEREGYTLIPLRLYFTRGKAKVAIGVCKGKKAYDKRHTIAERDADREVRRAMRAREKT